MTKREKIIEHVKWVEEHGTTDSDIETFCKENKISFKNYEETEAAYKFSGTDCETCPNRVMNLGCTMPPCNYCRDNFKWQKMDSYKGVDVRKGNR